jgi:hypothetical protein
LAATTRHDLDRTKIRRIRPAPSVTGIAILAAGRSNVTANQYCTRDRTNDAIDAIHNAIPWRAAIGEPRAFR